MNLISTLSRLFKRSESATGAHSSFDVEQFVYIKLPASLGPVERGSLFEDRIETALAKDGLGTVSGGGSSLGDEQPDGTRPIVFCGIDIDTKNRDGALAVLRDVLPTLNAPIGTELHYTRDAKRLQDEFTGKDWLLSQPRDFLHPGFGV